MLKTKYKPFGEVVPLFKNLPEQQIASLIESSRNSGEPISGKHPVIAPVLTSLRKALTKYGQYGTVNDEGALDPSIALAETPGAITRDKYPSFFDTKNTQKGTKEYTPDTAYMDVMSPLKMDDVSETMDEWDAHIEFVLMKETGQVKYGRLAYDSRSITNDVWGAGINIDWTWFETNKFKIKMNRLAPKAKFDYFDNMANIVYDLWISTNTSASRDFATVVGSAMTQHVVKDINTAMLTLYDFQNNLERYPFENANFRIVATPEAWWWLDQAFRSSRQDVNAVHFMNTPNVTFTNKLKQRDPSNPHRIYLFVEGWEQNVLTTRLPLAAHGPQDDIDVFASKMSWRGAWGAHIDANSFITLDFDPTNAAFVSQGIMRTDEVV